MSSFFRVSVFVIFIVQCFVLSVYGQSDSSTVVLNNSRSTFISPPTFDWLRSHDKIAPKDLRTTIVPTLSNVSTVSGFGASSSPFSFPSSPMVFTNQVDDSQFYTYFEVNSYQIDLGFMDNQNQHNKLDAFMSDLLGRSNLTIDSIVVYGSASPEGDSRRNIFLANERCKVVKSSISRRFPILDSRKILTYSKGEDWGGLKSAVINDPNVPFKDEVLGVLDMSSSRENREFFLRRLKGGKPWSYINSEILPFLRSGVSAKIYYRQYPVEDMIARDSVAQKDHTFVPVVLATPSIRQFVPKTLLVDTVFMRPDTIRIIEHRVDTLNIHVLDKVVARPLWAIKTNLLYWAALQPNVEAEFYFGNNWSLNFEYQVAWWKNTSKHQYYQYTQCGPEGRYWFKGDGNFLGHYVGLHVGFGIYDLSWGNGPDYQGYQGEFAIALGLTYGYTWKLGKLLHLEAGLGFGYIMTEYRRYRYLDECYVYQGTERMQFLGPTKARLALQWRIGTGANGGKKKRGGNR